MQRAIALGVNAGSNGMRQAEIRIATCLAGQGENERALDHITRAWSRWGLVDVDELLAEDVFAALRNDPRAMQLTGRTAAAETGDRDARWRADLAHFERLLRAVHPNPFHSCNEERWMEARRRVESSIHDSSDLTVTAGLMQLASMIGDGHTAVYPPIDGDLGWQLLGFFPLWLRDGWYVAAAAPGHESIVGARIVGAGGVAIEEIAAFAARHIAHDNEMTPRWLAAIALQFAQLYQLSGALEPGQPLRLQVERADGSRTEESFSPEAVTRDPNSRWAPADWPVMPAPVPLYLQHVDSPFYQQEIAGSGTVYAQVNQTANGDDVTMEERGRGLATLMNESEAAHLILDLRWNNGGNAFHARGFVDHLLAIDALHNPGSLFVLIGPRTFSATGYVLGMLEGHLDPVFVGLPSGCKPVNYSSERNFRLPYSGLTGSISYELRIDGESVADQRPWFAPDYVVWPDGEDLHAGRDPVLESVLDHMAGGQD